MSFGNKKGETTFKFKQQHQKHRWEKINFYLEVSMLPSPATFEGTQPSLTNFLVVVPTDDDVAGVGGGSGEEGGGTFTTSPPPPVGSALTMTAFLTCGGGGLLSSLASWNGEKDVRSEKCRFEFTSKPNLFLKK